jgi:tetratricopeptide (TPR) repeat protein
LYTKKLEQLNYQNKYKMMRKLFVVFLFCTFLSPANANEDHVLELNKLFTQLKSIEDPADAREVEDKIWKLWTTHPSEKTLTDLLAKGSNYMMQNQLTSAHNVFSKVIELDPNWAEGWNKRATVLYMMGNFELSQNDIDMVLSLEKRHFGALSGQGLVQTALQNYQKAIDSYIEAHKIYPSSQSTLQMIEQLNILIQKESI